METVTGQAMMAGFIGDMEHSYRGNMANCGTIALATSDGGALTQGH